MASKTSEQIWLMFETTVKCNLGNSTMEGFTLSQLRLAREELESHRDTAWFALLEDRIKDLEVEKEKRGAPDPGNKKVTPIAIPSDTGWEDITIQFKDGHNVDIKIKGEPTIRSNYMIMGFEDSKSRRPNKQWEFLQLLAENNGEISWEKSSFGKKTDIHKAGQAFGYEFHEDNTVQQSKGFSIIKAPDKSKKIKQLLSRALKAIFPIDSDPFFPYREVKAYKIKIKLIP